MFTAPFYFPKNVTASYAHSYAKLFSVNFAKGRIYALSFFHIFTLLRQRLYGNSFVHHAVEIVNGHRSQYAVDTVQKLGITLL